MTTEEILERLQEGNDRFQDDMVNGFLRNSDRRAELTAGQNPWAIVLSCADSRVVPEEIFDCGLGVLFTVRVAGNIANTSSMASIEYAVANLGTKVIVVMGHESCGAVGAAMTDKDYGKNLNHLLGYIRPAIKGITDIKLAVNANTANAAKELVSNSEIIKKAVEVDKTVTIVTAYYNIGSGAADFH